MAATQLAPGDVAIIGYQSGMSDATGRPATQDALHIVLLRAVDAGTTFHITDRTWVPTSGVTAPNAGTFAAAGGGDGTYTFSAGTALAAGTVISLSQAQLLSAGIDLNHVTGDAFYVYQGPNAATPTQFLFAAEVADGNTTFNASLVNTGLVAGQTAVAVAQDSGAYAGATTHAESFLANGAGTTLQGAVATAANWVGDDQDAINAIQQEVQTGPWLVQNDVDIWGVFSGIGGIARTRGDATVGGGVDDFNHVRLYQNLPHVTNLRDIVFDTADGKFFVVDSNISGANRILQGNIADLLARPNQAPVLKELFTVNGSDPTLARLDNMVVDTTNNVVYFTQGDKLQKLAYDTVGQTPVTLFTANATGNPAGTTNNFFNDMVIDFTAGKVYLSSTRVGASAGGDTVAKNFIYELSGLTTASGANAFVMNAGNTGTARLLPFVNNDDAYNPLPGTTASPASTANAPFFFALEHGALDGLAIDATTGTVYFSTGEILFDHDGSSATAPIYQGGIVGKYNADGTYQVLFQQPAQASGPVPGLMGDLEIDVAAGKWYVIDSTGTSGDNQDQHIWMGNLDGTGTPVQFTATIGDVEGSALAGFTLNRAPTLTGTMLAPTVTEADSTAGSGETTRVAVFSNLAISDVDTPAGDEIGGAVVRIAVNFQSGAQHQDYLRIAGGTSGVIAGSNISYAYNASTGAMVLTGAATVAEYKAALELVTFSTSGNDPTLHGTAGTRQLAVSVSDGLTLSDELTATVTVVGINDAPVIVPGAASNFLEDTTGRASGTPVNAVTGIVVSDVDVGAAGSQVSVTLTVGQGTLVIRTDVAGGLVAGQVTGNNSGALVLTGTLNQINATLAAVNGSSQANGLVFTPPANFNGSVVLAVEVDDGGATGLDPGLTAGAGSESDDATKTLNVGNVNDAPVVDGSGAVAPAAILEDTPVARLVSALFGGQYSDPADQQFHASTNPDGSVANAFAGIAVVGNGSSASTGQWQYHDGTSWVDIGAVAAGSAKLLAAGTSIRFTPAANFNGEAPTLLTHLVDNSAGALVNGSVVNLSGAGATGGATRYSSGTVTLSQTVTAVNDAPVIGSLAGDAAAYSEGGAAVRIDLGGNAVVSDVDSTNFAGGVLRVGISANKVAAEDLLTLDTGGTVTFSGDNVVVGGIVIGTLTGGTVGADLVISLNANATGARVNEVLRVVEYANTNTANPSTATRTVTVTLTDGDGTLNGGFDTATAQTTVTVTGVNDAPVLTTTGGSAAFVESATVTSTAVVIDAGLDLVDVDTGLMAGATVRISANFAAGDVLALAAGSGYGDIVASYNAGTGLLTLSSPGAGATLAEWQQALRSVTFNSSSQNPSTGTRVVEFSVSDGAVSGVQTRNVTVTPVNDPPALTATGGSVTYTEGGAAATLFSGVTASTIETGQTFTGLVLTVGNVSNGASEILRIDGSDLALTNGNAVTTATNGLTVEVTVAAGTATVSFTGAGLSAAALQTLVAGLQYRNASLAPTDAVRVVTLTQLSDSGSGTNPNVNTAALAIAASVDVDPVNTPASITGATTGDVTEAGTTAGTPTATGNLNATDVDNPADTWTVAAAGTASSAGYGSYSVTAAGVWTYTLDNGDATVQALNAGATLTDTFTVRTVDGTQQVVTITIEGQNDVAVITGATTGAVTEAGTAAGTATATGNLNATDVDNPADAWTVAAAGTASAAGYGSYALTAAGVWTYALDNGHAGVQALNAGDTLTDTFTVRTTDGTQQVVTITITGQNDAAVITGAATGAVTEAGAAAGTPTATGNLNAADVDNPADAWTVVTAGTASAGGYGSYAVTAAGVWTYALDNGDATVQALNAGETLVDTFTVRTQDGTQQVVSITIIGQNDRPVITGATTGAVTEAGTTAGTATATGNLNATDVDNLADAWTVVAAGTASTAGYGSYAVTAAGVWTYALDNTHASVQALNAGATLTDTFAVETVDGTPQMVTVTITGQNDAAVISGATTGEVTEAGGLENGTPGTPEATGNLNATDVDNAADTWTAVAAGTLSTGGYGTYAVTSAGVWTYTLDEDAPAVQALNAGATLTDTFTVRTADGTQQAVSITIRGQDDVVVITGTSIGEVGEAGGVANGSAGTSTASGDLDSVDPDDLADDWVAVAAGTGSTRGYGSYALTAEGVWTYTLDDSHPSVQALAAGATLIDTFTVRTTGGPQQVVTITIRGQNDAAVITGTAAGAVSEDGVAAGTPMASGNLDATDVDGAADAWTAVAPGTASTSGYGSYAMSAAGAWTYTLDNTHAEVQALNVGDTLTDTFTVRTADGTQQVVTVTIGGRNDAAVVTGATTGAVAEAAASAGTPTARGRLDAVDVDGPASTWTAVAAGTASTGGYGSYALTAAGVWTYALDNGNAAVQALNTGDTLTDTFTVRTMDGTSQVVSITIRGRNDAAVITGTDAGAVTEAGVAAGTHRASGNLNATDVDNPADAWTAVAGAASTGGYGSYALTATGAWTYTLNDGHAGVQALNAGATLTDTFTVRTVDGTPQVVSITIRGQNDAAVISGSKVGAVVERGAAAGTPRASGNLNAADVDNAADAWTAVAAGTASTGGYGSYALTATGAWTYTLNDGHAGVQALNAGATLTDTFTVRTVDGTQQVVSVTIRGQNDAAVITGVNTGAVVERGVAAGTPRASGNLNAKDVDNAADAWTAVAPGTASTGGYGTYALTATGAWTYTLDHRDASVQALTAGATLTDTFTVRTVDGTQQVVNVTIRGQNDAAVITGSRTGAVTERGVTAGTAKATGNLNATDVDNPADSWAAVAAGAASTGGYGSYALTTAGIWTYTLDNGHAAVQALNTGATLTDTFTVRTVDGTQQVVSVTIRGQNDAAVISGNKVGAVVESGAAAGTPRASGNLDATDVDNAADAWTAVAAGTASTGGYGSYALTATGAWTYTLNDGHAKVQALNAGATLTDSFTVRTVDGTQQVVSVTIRGHNDAAVITGTRAGVVTEAGVTAGTSRATGNLNAADVDNATDAWTAAAAGTASTEGYGSYALTASGAWTYTLDNSHAGVQALGATETLTDTFTVRTVDGTPQVVTVTIRGQNDAPAVATSAGSTAFVEAAQGASVAVVVDAGLKLADADSAMLAGARVEILGYKAASGEMLQFTGKGTSDIVGSFAGGVLTLSSEAGATQAQWQAALRSVSYLNPSDNPGTAPRSIQFSVNDGTADSAVAVRTVTVQPANDRPVVATRAGTATFVEGNNVTSTPVRVDAGITVADADNAGLASARVYFAAGYQAGQDRLAFVNDDASLYGSITARFGADGALALDAGAGRATLAQWQNALRAVTYTSGSQDPVEGVRSIAFVVNDGVADSVVDTRDVNVIAANDAPRGTVTISGRALEGRTLTASHDLADHDGMGPVVFQWSAGGSVIAGATGSSLTLTQAEVGKAITVTARYTDLNGTRESVRSAATAGVANVNDAPTGAVTITGTATVGRTLAAANTLADADGMGTVAYQWQQDGVDIAGATGARLVLTGEQAGKAITVSASYVDALGTHETIGSRPTVPVTAANALPTGRVDLNGQPLFGGILTASHTLADADGMGAVTYEWLVDGVLVPGATGANYVVRAADLGKDVSARATYVDGRGHAESVESPGLAVAPPQVTVVVPPGRSSLSTEVVRYDLPPQDGTTQLGEISLVADTLGGQPDADPSTAYLTRFSQGAGPELVRGFTNGLGVLSFEAKLGTPGGTETFSLLMDGDVTANGFWAIDSAGHWINLAGAGAGGAMVTTGADGKVRLDLQITDGGAFDLDGKADGVLSVAGLVGHNTLSLIGHVPDTGDDLVLF